MENRSIVTIDSEDEGAFSRELIASIEYLRREVQRVKAWPAGGGAHLVTLGGSWIEKPLGMR